MCRQEAGHRWDLAEYVMTYKYLPEQESSMDAESVHDLLFDMWKDRDYFPDFPLQFLLLHLFVLILFQVCRK